jgi:hypothetical protein
MPTSSLGTVGRDGKNPKDLTAVFFPDEHRG